jgi:hypothetical protein
MKFLTRFLFALVFAATASATYLPQTTIWDGTNTVSVSTSTADGVSITNNRLRVASAGMWYNGTTWDMARGDATNGAWVQLKSTLPAFAATPTFNLGTLNGAATAAKQPALGTSGSPSADVLTVQGSATMTPLVVGDGTTPISIVTSATDGVSVTANRVRASSVGMAFNGSTIDRVRAGVTGESGSATGYANVLAATGAVSGASLVSSTANEASRVIKASAGTLISLVGYNARTSAQFIQIFNSATVPADTGVPIFTFLVPSSSNFSLDVPVSGIPFTTGISVSNSSTQATKTIGSADCWFTAIIK